MTARRGAALFQVLVISVLVLAAAMAVIKWQLQRHHTTAKAFRQSELAVDVEGLRGTISSCLGVTGYPSGSCQPTTAQEACIPPGVTASFSGTPPACVMHITATR
jgi:hypothetical protein